jgi:hypothetical protein
LKAEAEGGRQKAEGRRQKAEGVHPLLFFAFFFILHPSAFCLEEHGISLATIRSERSLETMRIQETNAVLKESRYARNAAHQQHQEVGLMSRAKQMISKLTGMFRSK